MSTYTLPNVIGYWLNMTNTSADYQEIITFMNMLRGEDRLKTSVLQTAAGAGKMHLAELATGASGIGLPGPSLDPWQS
jgi:hypothetical protein